MACAASVAKAPSPDALASTSPPKGEVAWGRSAARCSLHLSRGERSVRRTGRGGFVPPFVSSQASRSRGICESDQPCSPPTCGEGLGRSL